MTKQHGRRIILTGFMGTGKTVIGRLVADQLGWPFVDTDLEIERQSGRRIAEIFREDGEAAFRHLEKLALQDSLRRNHVVIATGGGAIVDAENRSRMKQDSWLVCLDAPPEQIYQRLREADDRPLLKVPDPLAEIRRLLAERRPFYEEAHDVIETAHKDETEVAQEILHRYRARYPGETAAESL